jgi:hypothetical protein
MGKVSAREYGQAEPRIEAEQRDCCLEEVRPVNEEDCKADSKHRRCDEDMEQGHSMPVPVILDKNTQMSRNPSGKCK